MRFDEMGLHDELLRAIRENNYSEPTPIQEKAIPRVLDGQDVMCCAQTGTGKTAAFALPILQRLAEKERAHLRALILVPTRELAMQVSRNLREYGKHLDLVTTTVFGGVPIEPQEMMLRQGVDILVATPGRLWDHMWRGNIDFRHTGYLVLDEADRMLDMGFIKDVTEIVEMIPTERQSMLFSATLDREIQRLSKNILKDPIRIEVAPPATTLDEVDQFLVQADRGRKRSALESLIRSQEMKRAIIFVRTKIGASKVAGQLRDRGHRVSAIHSDRSQSERIRALEGFREGRIHFLVATDIAARGLDINDVSHVVNYDIPHSAEDYVHRIGRTARAGRKGMAISLVTREDSRAVEAIERLISMKLRWLDRGMSPATPHSTLVQAGGNGDRRRGTRSAERGARRGGNGRRPKAGGAHGNGSAARDGSARGNGRRPRAAAKHGNGKAAGASGESHNLSESFSRSGQPAGGREGNRRPRRRRSRRTPVATSEQRQRINSPTLGKGKKPAGIVQAILSRLRTGLFSASDH
jgi:ATP-dependent RNA helicase RhlE